MNNKEFLLRLKTERLVAVIRGKSADEAIRTAEACAKGGVRIIEITFTVPEAEKLIAAMVKNFGGFVTVGAGTVLNEETAKLALDAGAEFVVSPHLDEKLVGRVLKQGVACVPGILSPSELVRAFAAGAEIVKLFPGDVAKPEGLKALRAPFPDAAIMPTGGVAYDNLDKWFAAGAVAVGAGGNLTSAAKIGDYEAVKREAERWIERISAVKGKV